MYPSEMELNNIKFTQNYVLPEPYNRQVACYLEPCSLKSKHKTV